MFCLIAGECCGYSVCHSPRYVRSSA